MWKPDAEDFGGVTSGLISFGGLFWLVHYLDTIGYKVEGVEYVLIIGAIVAWFILFVPMSILGMFIEHGFKRKPLSDEDKRAWKNHKKYGSDW